MKVKKCTEIRDIMSLYLEGELSSDDINEVEEHVKSCDSCREELEDIKKIVELCNNLEEEELPENFKEQLHEKLVSVSGKKKSKILSINSSYIKVASSVAAILLFAVFLRAFFLMNGSYEKSAVQSVDDLNKSRGIDGADTNSVSSGDIAMKSFSGDYGNEETKPTSGVAGTKKGSSNEELKIAGEMDGNQSFGSIMENTVENAEITSFSVDTPKYSYVMKKEAKVTIEVDSLENGTKYIEDKAIAYGAEVMAEKSLSEAQLKENLEKKDNTSKIMEYRMQYNNYVKFVDEIKNGGKVKVTEDKQVDSDDKESSIKSIEGEIENTNKQIDEINKSENPDLVRLESLNGDLERLQGELESLKNDTEYVYIKINLTQN